MENCERNTDLLWDHLYGLLEPSEAQALRDHLADCLRCQGALAQAQTQQSVLARAARMYDSTAPFVLPTDEVPAKAAVAASATEAQPTTLKLSVKPPRRRRRWTWIGMAASLLLALGAYLWHQKALAEHRSDRDLALRHVQEVKQAKPEDEALKSQLVKLEVLGPATYQPGAPHQYRLDVRNLKDAPVPARVTVQVVAAAPKRRGEETVLVKKQLDVVGDATFSLASNLPAPVQAAVHLRVEAQGRGDLEKLEQPLALADPALLTRLAIDRAVYRRGEILFFRSLTLKRFDNEPPGQKMAIRATLVDAQGRRPLWSEGATNANGTLAGQIALTDDLCEGTYQLEVADRQGRFPPVQRPFILRGTQAPVLTKDLRFDKAGYAPGDKVQAYFKATNQTNGAPAANRQLAVTVTVAGNGVATATPITNAQGEANFQFMLPQAALGARASVEVQFQEQGQCERIVREVPVAGPMLARRLATLPPGNVEFFPEGGQLVAGLPSRVYFRARNPQGQPISLKAVLTDGQGQPARDDQGQAVVVRAEEDGLGMFRFQPQPGQSYALRIQDPKGMPAVPLPGVLKEGVALAVPSGVSTEGESLRVRVRQVGSPADLLVTASCGGRLVDQKAITVSSRETAVELNPPAGAHGVLRVTVYQVREGTLLPLAERLVFRIPRRRLQVDVRANKPQYQPGERVSLYFEARTEEGQPESAVLLAAVVDVNALRWGEIQAEPNLPAPFYLTTALQRPEDLEQADIQVEDSPLARAALDRFLGTQGWRRFSPPQGRAAPAPALAMAVGKYARTAADQRGLAILHLNNRASVQGRYEQEVQARKKRRLAEAEGRASEAAAALAEFEQLPRTWLRWAGVGLAGLLLVVGSVALLIGLVRLVRGRMGTPYLATAFGSLLLCLVAVMLGLPGEAPPRQEKGPENSNLALLAKTDREYKKMEEKADPLPEAAGGLAPAPAEVLKPWGIQLGKKQVHGQPGLQVNIPRKRELEGAGLDRASDKGGLSLAKEKARDGKSYQVPSSEMRRRFSLVARNQTNGISTFRAPQREESRKAPASRGATPPPPASGAVRGGAQGVREKSKDAPFGVSVDYAFLDPRQNQAAGGQETVLWYPLLLAANGKAEAVFTLSRDATTFQIMVIGHGPTGRLGIAHGTLMARPAGLGAATPAKDK